MLLLSRDLKSWLISASLSFWLGQNLSSLTDANCSCRSFGLFLVIKNDAYTGIPHGYELPAFIR